jgi:hypothetical protein
MVDFILFVFVVLVFLAGFWAGLYCGRTYQTFGAMTAAGKAWVKAKL